MALVEQQLKDACDSLIEPEMDNTMRVKKLEEVVNHLEVDLDDHCIQIIVAPATRCNGSPDGRQHDESEHGPRAHRRRSRAYRQDGRCHFSPTACGKARRRRARTRHRCPKARGAALDAFARTDTNAALEAIRADKEIDELYRRLVQSLTAGMRAQPESVEPSMNLIWAARALERAGDHAKNIGEYVIYVVQGEDVRHIDKSDLE